MELVEVGYEHQVCLTIAGRLHRGFSCDQYLYEREVKTCYANIRHLFWQVVIRMNQNDRDADDQVKSSTNSESFAIPFFLSIGYDRFLCIAPTANRIPIRLKYKR